MRETEDTRARVSSYAESGRKQTSMASQTRGQGTSLKGKEHERRGQIWEKEGKLNKFIPGTQFPISRSEFELEW